MHTGNRLAAAIAACLFAATTHASPDQATTAADWTAKLDRRLQQGVKSAGAFDVLIELPPAPTAKQAPGHRPFAQQVGQVVGALRAHAEVSQAPLLGYLRAQGIEAQPLWIANVVVARVDRMQLEAIAARDDVIRIESDALLPQRLPQRLAEAPAKAANAVEPNLVALGVPEAWAAGARGAGVVVGGQDTGYDWSHPALRDRYRGWNGSTVDHRGHWFDAVRAPIEPGPNACGYASAVPCDDGSHGTHTMGTAVGDGGPDNAIGVAPEARWIGCRNMDRGVGRPSTYLGCFQFFLAPTDPQGNDPQPALAPHVMVNSWGCPLGPPPAGEECALQSFDQALANVRAAGILTVVAAGNGPVPTCGSVDDPPALSAAVLTVGASDNQGAIAPFSLWGPVTADGSGRLKPDLVGPGVAVRSTVPGGLYAVKSGTSMATPGVAGVAALMLGANPLLIGQPDETIRLLKATAAPTLSFSHCPGFPGSATPNAVFGHGRVDAAAAVAAATREVVGPGHAGSWFDPARNGEGWILELLDDGSAVLFWFTYPPSGSAAEQDWLVAANGRVEGNRIRFDDVRAMSGGRFGAAFDPAAIRSSHWGTIEFRFDGCAQARLDYAGPPAYGSASRNLTRLTTLSGTPCGQPLARGADTVAARSGAWFDPTRSGEGWLIEAIGDGRAALYWFTYGPDGQPAWLFGVGTLDAGTLRVGELRRMRGTRFGAAFSASELDSTPWGTLEIDFSDCDGGELRYRANDPAYGDGARSIVRLTRLLGPGCGASAGSG